MKNKQHSKSILCRLLSLLLVVNMLTGTWATNVAFATATDETVITTETTLPTETEDPTENPEETGEPETTPEPTVTPGEADDFLLDEFDDGEGQSTIAFDASGIDPVYDWYMADVEQQLPEADKDYALVFPVPEGYALPESLTVTIDETAYTVYTDGLEHRELPEDGAELPPMPVFDPLTNTLTIPAVLLTETTQSLAVSIAAVALDDTLPEDTVTEPTEDGTVYEDTDDTGNTDDTTPSEGFTATLYPNGDGHGTGVELTSNGTATIALDSGANKLIIDWTFNQGSQHILDITVPAGMYIDPTDGWTSAPAGALESVGFTALDIDPDTDGTQQGTGTYVNDKTGTIRYTSVAVDETSVIKTERIELFVRFDRHIWDHETGHSLTGDKPAVTVSTSDVATDGTIGSPTMTKTMQTATTEIVSNLTFNNYWYTSTSGMSVYAGSEFSNVRFYFQGGGMNNQIKAFKSVEYTVTVTVTRNGEKTDIVIPVSKLTTTDVNGNMTVTLNAGENGESNVAKAVITDYSAAVGEYHNLRVYIKPDENVVFQTGDKVNISVTAIATPYIGTPKTYTNNKEISTGISGDGLKLHVSNSYVISDESGWFEGCDDAVEFLGLLAIYNEDPVNAATNVEVSVLFDTDVTAEEGNKPNLLVSYYRVPFPANVTPVLTNIVLVNAEGTYQEIEASYSPNNTSSVNQNGCAVIAQKIATENNLDGTWYLKSFDYVISEIPANTVLYAIGSANSPTSGGTIYGRLAKRVIAYSSITVKTDTIEKTGTASSRPYDDYAGKTNMLYIRYIDDLTIRGGEKLDYSFTLSVRGYPYTYTFLNKNPTIIFVAPKGVCVTAAKFGTVAVDPDNIQIVNTDSEGNKTYLIKLSSETFGYLRLNTAGTALVNEDRVVTLSLEGDVGLDSANYDMKNRLMTTALQADGTPSKAQNGIYMTEQTIVINGTSHTQVFGSYSSQDTHTIHTKPFTSALSTSAYISDGTHTYTGSRADRAMKIKTGDIFTYNLTVTNNTGFEVEKTNNALYIPIPKAGQTLPNSMGGVTPAYSLELMGAVSGGDACWDICYSTTATKDNYCNNAATFDDQWKTAREITDWSAVTMIKAVLKDNYADKATDSFELTLRPAAGPVGNHIICASAQWCLYDANGENNNGAGVVQNTAYIRVVNEINDMTYGDEINGGSGTEESHHRITVTANGTENDLQTVIDLANKGGMELIIKSVTANNMDLVTQDKINTDTAAGSTLPSVEEQDKSFALTLSMNGTTVDLASTVPETTVLGTTNANAVTPLTVTLGHYPTFIDASTDRNVVITLADADNSVKITITIHIARNLSQAEAQTAILAGKYYGGLGGSTASTAAITQDSAFTAQFSVTGYIPDNYNDPALVFTGTIPADIPLLLIDATTVNSPVYYSTTTTGDTSISLNSFTSMTGSGSFSMGTGRDPVTKNLILVADLAKANLGTESYTLTLQATLGSNSTAQNLADQLSITVGAKRSFAFKAGSDMGTDKVLYSQMELNYTLTTAVGNGTDYQWNGNGQAIVLTLKGKTFPAGSYVTYGGSTYTAAPNGSYILVPVGTIGSVSNVSMTLHTPSHKLADGSYTLVAENWISATADSTAPMGGKSAGTVKTTFTVNNAALHNALSLTAAGDDRLFTAAEAKDGITLTIGRNTALEGTALTLTVEQKVGDGFVQLTKSELQMTGITGNSVTISLDLTSGTYRFVLGAPNGSAETTLTFIITE